MRPPALALLSLAIGSSAFAQSRQEKQATALLNRSVESLIPLVQVRGDALDPRITITSEGVTAFTSKGWLASTTTEDSFLRAFIDKKSGNVTAQIYHRVSAGGRAAPSINRATYEFSGEVTEVDAIRIGFDVSCARYGCTYYEDVGVPISHDALKAVAEKHDPSDPVRVLRYRLFGRSGQTFDDGVPGNEIAAFVAVVERERGRIATVATPSPQ